MFGLALNLKWITIASVVVAALSFGGGWKARDAFCDAAYFKEQTQILRDRVSYLERNIERIAKAAEADADAHATDAAEIARLEGIINETKLESGICFPDADADRVRDLWK
jgi:hypothetical protein